MYILAPSGAGCKPNCLSGVRFGQSAVLCKHLTFQFPAYERADGMHDVVISPVRCAPRGHGEEQMVVTRDNLDVVHGEHVVECDRYQGEQPSLSGKAAEFDLGNLHKRCLLYTVLFGCRSDVPA